MTSTLLRQLTTIARHLTAAATRTRTAIEALHSQGRQAPPDALALLSDLDTAAELAQQISHPEAPAVKIVISPADRACPADKIADAEVHFTSGIFAGLKFIGFAVWQRRGGNRSVTFPARSYQVNNERRSFALLRPATFEAGTYPDVRVRDLILEAYRQYEEAEGTDRGTWAYNDDGTPWTPRTIDAIGESDQEPAPLEPSPLESSPDAAEEWAIDAHMSEAAQALGTAAGSLAYPRRHMAAQALDQALDTAQQVARSQEAPTPRPRRF